jgi:hypothetical protein
VLREAAVQLKIENLDVVRMVDMLQIGRDDQNLYYLIVTVVGYIIPFAEYLMYE